MKFPNAPNKYNLGSVFQYYSKLIIGKLFHLSDTSEGEILKIMQNINILKAAGIDNLSQIILKDGVKILAKPISEICNLSNISRTFSNVCEVVKPKLIFKIGWKTDPSNYITISWLPLISKLLEMIIHDQTNTLLKEKNLLFNYQSGFKTNHLTNLCSSFLKDKIVKEFNEGLLVEMILIDH